MTFAATGYLPRGGPAYFGRIGKAKLRNIGKKASLDRSSFTRHGRTMTEFGANLVAMVTPMEPGGALSAPGLTRLVEHLLATGCDGLVVGGTTGESRPSPTPSPPASSGPWPPRWRTGRA